MVKEEEDPATDTVTTLEGGEAVVITSEDPVLEGTGTFEIPDESSSSSSFGIVEEDPAVPCVDYTEELGKAQGRVDGLEGELEANEAELDTLSEGRCTANMLFVEALKEHRLGIEILAELQQMVSSYDTGSVGSFIQERQFTRLYDSLQALAMTSDKKSAELVGKIFDKLNMVQLPD